MAAPSSINDCEKIEAADAYNRCLALFGPVPHTHGASSAKDFGGDGDVGAKAGDGADVVEAVDPEASVPKERRSAHATHGRHAHAHSTRHDRHYSHYHDHGYSHYHAHGHSNAHETHGARKKVAFNVVSSHVRAR